MRIKIQSILVLLILLISLGSCTYPNAAWKEVKIEGIGTFKVPKDWALQQRGNVIWFSDYSDNKMTDNVYLKGVIIEFYKTNENNDAEEFYSNIKHSRAISGEGFSNSAEYGIDEYIINGKIEEKYSIELGSSEKNLVLISLDDKVDKDTLIKIAKSFSMELEK